MANIGFELRFPSRDRSLSGALADGLFGASVVAGPWILTVLAMGLLQATRQDDGDAFALQSIIIYIFFITLLATAPVIALCGRLLADDLYRNDPSEIADAYVTCLFLSWLSTTVIAALLLFSRMSVEPVDILIAVQACGLASLMWPSFAFASSVKRYGLIGASFAIALVVSVGASLALREAGFGAPVQAVGFSFGLALGSSIIGGFLLRAFGGASVGAPRIGARLSQAWRDHRPLVLGAAFAVAAIWIDSVVMWLGPLGIAAANGLETAPTYDSAMFVARLAMVPGLAFNFLAIDPASYGAIRRYLQGIEERDTLVAIQSRLSNVETLIDLQLRGLLVLQTGLTGLFVVLVPFAIPFVGLAHVQIATLQFGILGALFHVIFFAATALVLNCGAERDFMRLQVLFFVLNGGGAALSLLLPSAYLGVGYFLAALVSGLASLYVLQSVLQRLTRLTFERGLTLASGARRRGGTTAALLGRIHALIRTFSKEGRS
ncbi:hypothetical protein DYI37_10400 [Fulvimarina endophytica]|uniref:Polysaccharide biosynthesis protein C-terminal domain-containing protein n=1 Tax=Fulvimarina endophytica TaxID=2293836 RepID=A0A371X2J5_9HYPH|nr:exopolysaccharide Pel transporter PelG [Fulvimarina endophytica]RFC63439.1 hypothetical protein DYI37_10400 [Fulvimarina endophytica]